MKRDIKKSSYYVWFLGAEEAKGLRGIEFMLPVIRNLVEREKEMEPFKVTLQVSHKGVKILQNTLPNTALACKTGPSRSDIIKHFIPHQAITSVLQQRDIVSCILLLFNPATKCPVHAHAYRCDSVETAQMLRQQLQTLIERPENQKKLREIERRLTAKGLIPYPTIGCERMTHSDGTIASLYDSLATELKDKLNATSSQKHAPILLPPRDYDTAHRRKGNFYGIDVRRCLNSNIVGANSTLSTKPSASASASKNKLESSGIGSDRSPSPQQECDCDNRPTSSDEEWDRAEPSGRVHSLFSMESLRNDLSLPRVGRSGSFLSVERDERWASDAGRRANPVDELATGGSRYLSRPNATVQDIISNYRINGFPQLGNALSTPRLNSDSSNLDQKMDEALREQSLDEIPSPKDRFKDAKEKFRALERERLNEQERQIKGNFEKKKVPSYPESCTKNTDAKASHVRNLEDFANNPSNLPHSRQKSAIHLESSKISIRDRPNITGRTLNDNSSRGNCGFAACRENTKQKVDRLCTEDARNAHLGIVETAPRSLPNSHLQRKQPERPPSPYQLRDQTPRKCNEDFPPSADVSGITARRFLSENVGIENPDRRCVGAPFVKEAAIPLRRYRSDAQFERIVQADRKLDGRFGELQTEENYRRQLEEEKHTEEALGRYYCRGGYAHDTRGRCYSDRSFGEGDNRACSERDRYSASKLGRGPSQFFGQRDAHPYNMAKSYEDESKRRSFRDYDAETRQCREQTEEEKKRNSNELAREFKRKSYRDHSFYPNDEATRGSTVTSPIREATAWPRYRHSYAEPEPFHNRAPTASVPTRRD